MVSSEEIRSKLYAYSDESGHSGKRLFDSDSPYFYQGCIVALDNLENIVSPVMCRFTEKFKVERIHAVEIAKKYGINNVFEICENLIDILKNEIWSFHCTIIEKDYIPSLRFFDTFFDFIENKNVNREWMLIKYKRHLIIVYLYVLMKDGLAEDFWAALCCHDKERAKWVCLQVSVKAKKIYNIDVRFAIRKALCFAYENMDVFTYFKEKGGSAYKDHTPNMIGFYSITSFIKNFCKKHNVCVDEFFHDLSDEFKGNMRKSHGLMRQIDFYVDDENFIASSGSEIDLGEFKLVSSKGSSMLQAVDLFLWTVRYAHMNKNIKSNYEVSQLIMKFDLDLFELSFSNSMNVLQGK